MSNIKDYGLTGVASSLQLGKTGGSLVFDKAKGEFNFTKFDISQYAPVFASDINAATGDVNILDPNKGLKINGTVLGYYGAGILKFDSNKAVMIPVGTATDRPAGEPGMIRANNAAGEITIEYFDGTVWKGVGTGGVLQTEINNIKTALGTAVNPTTGVFDPSGFTNNSALNSPTSFTNAIQQVADYASAHDTLDKILAPGPDGSIIYSNGTSWQQALPGATSGVQGYSQRLTNLAADPTTGIVVQYDANSYIKRTITSDSTSITITNGDGILGNPTINLGGSLAGIIGLTTAGYTVRNSDGTWQTRSIAGTTGNIRVNNGDGVLGETTIDLETVTPATAGDFVKVQTDTYGRVTGKTAVTTADLTGLLDTTYLKLTGGTLTGNAVLSNGAKLTGLPAPTDATDAVSKSYVDNLVSGLSWKQAVRSLSDVNIDVLSPVSADIGGQTLTSGDRVLLKGQTNNSEDGIWIFTGVGSAMYRATDADPYTELNGAAVFVQDGTYGNRVYTQTTTLTSFAGQVWVQFGGGGGATYAAGAGINISVDNIISAKLGAGVDVDSNSALTTKLYSTGALILTTDGSTNSTDPAAGLFIKLDGAGGLSQGTSGLKIADGGITPAMLQSSGYTYAADFGAPATVDLGKTIGFTGGTDGAVTATLSTNTSGASYTLSIRDASTTVKGIARFSSTNFSVDGGEVSLKLGGIPNNALANPGLLIQADSGNAQVELGQTLTVAGGFGITTEQIGNTLGINADKATTTTPGVASFSATSFTVTDGAVDLKTVPVSKGGTGQTLLSPGQVLIGNGAQPVVQTDALAFDTTNNVLSVGGNNPVQIDGQLGAVMAQNSNSDLILMAGAQGAVLVGPTGDVLLASGNGEDFTIRATDAGLTLQSGSGSTLMRLPINTTSKIRIMGPSAAQYAAGLSANDLVNKEYVDSVVVRLNGGTFGGP